MTYSGRVQGGAIVVDGEEKLIEGTVVRIETVESSQDENSSLSKALLKLSGIARGLPPDASLNHDHYLYGVAKK